MTNKYKGTCSKCGATVSAKSGILERQGRQWVVYCTTCNFDKRDHSSYEDRACGDMAYEDRCAEMCGY